MTLLNNQVIAEKIALLAVQSLLYEAALSPKPGLVDSLNNGSHKDMDLYTFIDSSVALTPFFTRYVLEGFNHSGSPEELFKKVRWIGMQAEKEMLVQTNGVNTHKGANFSFALILSALGKNLQPNSTLKLPLSKNTLDDVFNYVKKMCTGLITNDFQQLSNKKTLSYGESLFIQYGFTGIRGEAEAGYPTVSKIALPFLRNTPLENNQHKLLLLLIKLMASMEDSNVINRGGMKGWAYLKKEAADLLKQNSIFSSFPILKEKLTSLDKTFITLNLSPGGAADLLALSIFLGKLEHLL